MSDPEIHDPPLRCMATANFAPRHEDELPLTEGDIVFVGHTPAGGWWEGANPARRVAMGWFPANHVRRIVESSQPAQPSDAYQDPEKLLGYPRLGLYEELPDEDQEDSSGYVPLDPDPMYEKEEKLKRGGDTSMLHTPAPVTPKLSKLQQQEDAFSNLPKPKSLNRSNVTLDKETKSASWFVTDMPREQVRWWAKQLLEAGPVGGYIVREPDSQKDAFALVVKVKPTAIKNYLVKCELVEGIQTFRLGTVRSRSLFRLCEKLAVMDSPLATRLLPGFFLNKKAALKKAMRGGEKIPGLVPENFTSKKEQRRGRVRTPPPREEATKHSSHRKPSDYDDGDVDQNYDDLSGKRRSSGASSAGSREKSLSSSLQSFTPTQSAKPPMTEKTALAGLLQDSLSMRSPQTMASSLPKQPTLSRGPPPPVAARTSSLSSAKKPVAAEKAIAAARKPPLSISVPKVDLSALPGPPQDLLSSPVSKSTPKKHNQFLKPKSKNRPQSGAYGFGADDDDDDPEFALPGMMPIQESSESNTPQKASVRLARPNVVALGSEHLGREVTVQGYGAGELRYVGPHKSTGRMSCGVELYDANGDHDGAVGDDLYFFGTPGHCIVVPTALVTLAEDMQDTPGFSDDDFDC